MRQALRGARTKGSLPDAFIIGIRQGGSQVGADKLRTERASAVVRSWKGKSRLAALDQLATTWASVQTTACSSRLVVTSSIRGRTGSKLAHVTLTSPLAAASAARTRTSTNAATLAARLADRM